MDRTLGPLCIVICIALLVAGLWPLDFHPRNRVSWLEGRTGLAFQGDALGPGYSPGGLLLSPGQLGPEDSPSSEKRAMSIEMWLRPHGEPGGCRYHILGIYDESKNNLFFVCQWKSHLLIRVRKKDANGRAFWKEIGVDHALRIGTRAFLTITSGQRGTAIYLDGRLAESFPDDRLLPESESISAQRVRIGNSLDGGCSWSGEVFGLSFYDRVLSDDEAARNFQWWLSGSSTIGLVQNRLVGAYTFTEGTGSEARSTGGSARPLSIPARLHFQKSLLAVPELGKESSRSLLKDGAVNIVGFVPFGFLLCMWLVRVRRWLPLRAFLLTVCAGMMISFFIESVQVFLPQRDSSFLDLCCNTIGAGLGVIGARKLGSEKQGGDEGCAEYFRH